MVKNMVFTTQVFLFLFFPLSLAAFYGVHYFVGKENKFGAFLKKIKAREWIIVLASLVFYAWSGISGVKQLIGYILIVYALAKWIEHSANKQRFIEIKQGALDEEGKTVRRIYICKIVCIAAVSCLLFLLFIYKYMAFFFNVFNEVFGQSFAVSSIVAPIGLSFLTFSAISYLVDIYRNKGTAGSLLDCALYLSFFPKIISGPIVLWQDFQPKIGQFACSMEKGVQGLNRIMVGFVKKVIFADTFGKCIALIGVTNIDGITAAATLLLYALQIYYDFAGYSDIAIGLAKLFGLDVADNFNFPYRSTSITEFWRRWHISLGNWFKEYVYFPLGGNRKGKKRTLLNLGVVFLLTGLWHGAGRAYILWGMINAFFIIVERLVKDKKAYIKTPQFIKYLFTMGVVVLFWQLFRFEDIDKMKEFFNVVLGRTRFENIPYTWKYYLDGQMIFFIVAGVLGATVLGDKRIKAAYEKGVATKAGYLVQEIVLLALFIVAILFMVSSTYNPFIYFQY